MKKNDPTLESEIKRPKAEDIYSPEQANEYQPIKESSVLSSVLLILFYLVLAAVGIAFLGVVALFVVCMV